jgi:hypothetical protein
MLTHEDTDTNLPITRSFEHTHVAPVHRKCTREDRLWPEVHSKTPQTSCRLPTAPQHRLQLFTGRYACEAATAETTTVLRRKVHTKRRFERTYSESLTAAAGRPQVAECPGMAATKRNS